MRSRPSYLRSPRTLLAERLDSVPCVDRDAIREAVEQLIARAQALLEVVESGGDPDGIGLDARAEDCLEVAQTLKALVIE